VGFSPADGVMLSGVAVETLLSAAGGAGELTTLGGIAVGVDTSVVTGVVAIDSFLQ